MKKHLIKRILRIFGWLLMPLLIYLKFIDYYLIDSWKIPLRKTDVLVNFLISLNTFIYILAFSTADAKDIHAGKMITSLRDSIIYTI